MRPRKPASAVCTTMIDGMSKSTEKALEWLQKWCLCRRQSLVGRLKTAGRNESTGRRAPKYSFMRLARILQAVSMRWCFAVHVNSSQTAFSADFFFRLVFLLPFSFLFFNFIPSLCFCCFALWDRTRFALLLERENASTFSCRSRFPRCGCAVCP
jgi:hypothetical protein